jgi:formylglycine-generating enzyme required for sulfatase activity
LTAPFDEAQAKAAQEAWAKSLGKSSPVETNSIGMELVLIPPGKSTMGTPASEMGRMSHEEQEHLGVVRGRLY